MNIFFSLEVFGERDFFLCRIEIFFIIMFVCMYSLSIKIK